MTFISSSHVITPTSFNPSLYAADVPAPSRDINSSGPFLFEDNDHPSLWDIGGTFGANIRSSTRTQEGLRCRVVRGHSPPMLGADVGKQAVVFGLIDVVHPTLSARVLALCTMLFRLSQHALWEVVVGTCLLSWEACWVLVHCLLEERQQV